MILRYVIGCICVLVLNEGWAQKFLSDSSYVHFFSSAPMEDIEAVNTEGSSALDLATGEFVFKIPVKGFEFDKSLMQEHFNENYLESDKYPNALFKGKIKDWAGMKGDQKVIASGEMTIHGVTRQVEIKSAITYTNDLVKVSSDFPVELKEYKIKIPRAVFYNIAEVVDVKVYFKYKPYDK